MKNLKIIDFLKHGRENGIPAADLAARLHISTRSLRARINAERKAGVEILITPGGHGGYFLPSLDPKQAAAERAAYDRQASKRAVGTLDRLAPVRAALAVPVGQTAMDDPQPAAAPQRPAEGAQTAAGNTEPTAHAKPTAGPHRPPADVAPVTPARYAELAQMLGAMNEP